MSSNDDLDNFAPAAWTIVIISSVGLGFILVPTA